jgi:hypothetical protein
MQSCSSMFDTSSQSFQRQDNQEVHAFSKMANFNFYESWFGFFFIFWDSWPETLPPPPFKVFVYGKGVQNRSKFTKKKFFNFHQYFLGGIRLSMPPS